MSTPPAPPEYFNSHPELPDGLEPRRWPRWPPWASVAAFVAGAAATLVGASIVGIIAVVAFDAKTSSPGVTIVGSVVQDMCLIGAALVFARLAGRPLPAHFGLRRTGVKRALVWMLATWVAFFVFTGAWVAVWGALTGDQPENDEALEGLGVDRSTAAMLGAAFLVSVVAPIGEEFFFRGFFYGALRNWRGPWLAAVLTGLVFGIVHFSSSNVAFLVPLAFFGFGLCLLYERTGSLYPCIALHCANNSLAFGTSMEWSWQIALLFVSALGAIGLLVLTAQRVWSPHPPAAAPAAAA
ncbi:MAG TPA: CPBP family intramembrane glutamic endopeptidase [Solirubrobacteraceae bacterium]|nr:CPBP family intramembrane glutamic endopeptidase [Solirubrobacteraceae bacterium]